MARTPRKPVRGGARGTNRGGGATPAMSGLHRALRRAAIPGAILTVIAFFGAYAVLGRNGVLAYGDYKRQLAKREVDYQALDRRRQVLRNRVALLNPDHANPDMVDEMVRKELNVAHPDEVIVPLR